MNYKMIRYTLGWLLLFEALFFLLPLVTGIIFWEKATLSFLYSLLIVAAVGTLFVVKKPKNTNLYSRDGFMIVALSWVFLSLFGALPFVFSGATNSYIDAFFETVSGFTTTGASIFLEVESLPKSVLIWRSFTNWVGGMGVLVFIMAFLPLSGAHNMNIMKAESPGPSVSKLVPKIKTTALILYLIYLGFTLLHFVLLLFGKMNAFEALNAAFSTAGTGGFSVNNDSFISSTPYAQVVTSVFLLVYSINFASYYLALRGRFRESFSTEIRVFLIIVVSAVSLISFDVFRSGNYASFGEALRHSLFNVSSIISTAGFASADFNIWPALSKTLLVLLMFIGACAGSTGGGIKVSRLVILVKGMSREVRTIIHPRRVRKISIDGKTVDRETVRSVNAYMMCYIIVFVVSLILISFEEHDLVTNFTAVVATINNIGPGLEMVGPVGNYAFFSGFSKLVLSFDMLAGRLELFPMLILFYPGTYKKQ
jgi:trk system potassium uptake protein TrkH